MAGACVGVSVCRGVGVSVCVALSLWAVCFLLGIFSIRFPNVEKLVKDKKIKSYQPSHFIDKSSQLKKHTHTLTHTDTHTGARARALKKPSRR